MGFQSQSQFQKHWLRCHQDTAPKPNQLIDDPDDDEIQPLLFDLVTMGKLDEVSRLLPRFRELPREVKKELKKLAAFAGSLAMVQLLLETFSPANDVSYNIIVESMKGENIEVLSWAASEFQIEDFHSYQLEPIHGAAMSSSAAEVLELWEKNFSKLDLWGSPCVVNVYLIRAVKSPMQEIRLSTLWKERVLSGELSTEHLNAALMAIAKTTCSIVLAKALLECGANVNFKKRNITSKTVLHVAATKITAAAAELMKLLLLSGADPNISAEAKRGGNQSRDQRIETTPSMERGAQNISKWLGMTWDQLVKWAEEQRRKRSQNEPES
jgi:ankyrin repeat protein